MINSNFRLKVKTYKVIKNIKTQQQGLECTICNNVHYDDMSVIKKYCPHCNIHHEYANYLSFIE